MTDSIEHKVRALIARHKNLDPASITPESALADLGVTSLDAITIVYDLEEELGIEVPRDVSVAGFDDIAVASMTAPSLSTVRLPLREMGRRGFTYAARVLGDDAVAPESLPTEVILRDSTSAPPTVALPASRLASSAATSSPSAATIVHGGTR